MHWDFDLRAVWDIAGRNFAARFLSALLLTNFVYLRTTTRLSILRCVLADLAMVAMATVAVLPSILVGALLRMAVSGTTVSSPTLVLILAIFAMVSTGAESAMLLHFQHRVTIKGFWILVLVNAFCLALAFIWTIMRAGPVVA
jgi:hypothetical protein